MTGTYSPVVVSLSILGAILAVALVAALISRELRRRSLLALENERLFREAEEAHEEARHRAEQAEQLAEELQSQAVHLEEQASELEALNDELLSTEARLRAVIDSSLDAVITTDASSVITDWSRHAHTIFGWSAEEALGRRLGETIIPPRYREAHDRGVERYMATGEGPILNRRIEIVALHRDGHEFPVELTVSPARAGPHVIFSAFVRDITERRQVEQRLAAENAVTRVLAESLRLQEAAPQLLQAIGETLDWDFGAFWTAERGEEHLRCLAVWCRPSLEAGAFEEESRRCTFARGQGLPGRVWEAGSPVWITDIAGDPNFPRAPRATEAGLHSAIAFPVLQGGAVLAVVEFFHREALRPNAALMEMVAAIGADIGQAIQRIRAEEERDRALGEMARINAELQQANDALHERTEEAERARRAADEANQAKSEFLANMSHELRTPINAIVGFTDLLEMGIAGPLTDKQRSHLERIRSSSQHLLTLIEDVLDLAKIEAGRLGVDYEQAFVGNVVAAALSLVGPQAVEREIEIENACAETRLAYIGDEDRVRQILLNLLSNALKFTEPGGRVTVRCGVAEEPGGEMRPEGAGPWVCIQVEDTGIGIGPEDAAGVFEPFIQAEKGRTRTRGGTGLGLTISRRLARLMGGDLTLRSELGQGSCFSLWLPTSDNPDQAALVDDAGGQDHPQGLAWAGEMVQQETPRILERVAARLRADSTVPQATSLSQAELEDHQDALLTDIGQTLVILEQAGGETRLLRDSSDLQRLIALRHGMQRARHHWTEQAMRAEYAILREEIAAAVQRRAEPGAETERALQLLKRLLEQCEQLSLRGLRTAATPPR